MKTEQLQWTLQAGWDSPPSDGFKENAQLVLVFGSRVAMENPDVFNSITDLYPTAAIAGCTTSGEILGADVFSESLVVTAIQFDHTHVQLAKVQIEDSQQSLKVGEELSRSLVSEDLTHVIILSDGLRVNGTDLVRGLQKHLPSQVQITGGLAGDGESFEKTLVCCDGPPTEGQIAAVGFYGSRLHVGYGSLAGWAPFGPERLITKSKSNRLYELDGQPALELYRTILNEEGANALSAARFHFPLEIHDEERNKGLVRTVIAVDEEDNSLVFAGDVPEGNTAYLMKANITQLTQGAAEAAHTSSNNRNGSTQFAFLVSCVGRKIVLKQRTFLELEAVQEVLGQGTPMAGFYSYGELAPFATGQECHLHNETMTITTFSEA